MLGSCVHECFSPVAGILLIESWSLETFALDGLVRFSPVAGILLIESSWAYSIIGLTFFEFQSRCRDSINWKPQLASLIRGLSGFSPVAGILLIESNIIDIVLKVLKCFSPVAGILLIERLPKLPKIGDRIYASFSPVAGILLIESKTIGVKRSQNHVKFQSRCRDSINWKALSMPIKLLPSAAMFQSRCRDSINWKLYHWGIY